MNVLQEIESKSKSKSLESPKYNIIIWNDDVSQIKSVISLIINVFNYSEKDAINLTESIHNNLNTVVWAGTKEVGEFRIDQSEKFKKGHMETIGQLKITLEKDK